MYESEQAIKIEIFSCDEIMSENHPEIEDEAKNIIEQLGLEGQAVNGKRNPFREMTKEEVFTYKVLCPSSYDIEKYSRTPIPYRVLQALNYCKENNFFHEYKIWDVQEQLIKDPVLVGKQKEWNSPWHIIARWGEELDEYIVLKEKALKIAISRWYKSVASIKDEAETLLSREPSIEEMTNYDGGFRTPSITGLF